MINDLDNRFVGKKDIRVLIVDDSKDYCEVLSSFINEKDGLEVVGAAYNGLQAVELINELKPDVVLLDVIMPLLDGMGVLESFAAVEDKPKFIMLTGFGPEEIVYQAFKLGASYFIMKPFDHKLLVERIKEFSGPANSNPFRKNDKGNDLDNIVTGIMHDMGIPVHIKGYHFLRESIIWACEDQSLLGALTKELYPRIAQKFDTTPSKVERSIRNAIRLACARGNTAMIDDIFQYSAKTRNGKLTNGQFISTIADRLMAEG